MSRLGPSLVLILATGWAGCGGGETPPPRHAAVAEPEPVEVVEHGGPSQYDAEIGGLSQDEIESELRTVEPKLVACVNEAATSMSYVGGRASLKMRVDREGGVRWAYLKETTLGDRDVERCVLGVVKNRTWPRPKSGEGLAETSFDVEAANPPPLLTTRTSSRLAERASAATRKCRKGVKGAFTATAYFGARGEVLSVGVAPPDERGEPAVDCVADALKDLRVERRAVAPNTAAKVSFRIR